MTAIANACLSCLSAVDRWCHITACLGPIGGRSRDGIYETTLADNEREAVSDLLGYLENVRLALSSMPLRFASNIIINVLGPLSAVEADFTCFLASRNRLLLRRTSSRPEHLGLF